MSFHEFVHDFYLCNLACFPVMTSRGKIREERNFLPVGVEDKLAGCHLAALQAVWGGLPYDCVSTWSTQGPLCTQSISTDIG